MCKVHSNCFRNYQKGIFPTKQLKQASPCWVWRGYIDAMGRGGSFHGKGFEESSEITWPGSPI